MNMKRKIDLRELEKVFEKHDYFNDDKLVEEDYGVLLEVYSCLTQEGKEEMLTHCKLLRRCSSLQTKKSHTSIS